MKRYAGIIFDLDGVICITDKYHYEAWKSVTDELGIYFDEQINNRLIPSDVFLRKLRDPVANIIVSLKFSLCCDLS